MGKKKTITVVVLIILIVAIIAGPLFLLKDAQFEGSDAEGSKMVSEVTGGEYEPWFTPILETLTGREWPGEIETLLFCIQTGLGVGILAFCFGYLVARKKYGGDDK